MAVSAYLYGQYLYYAVVGSTTNEMKWTANGIKCILCTSSYTPNQDTHKFYSDITNEHTATDSGYTVGGVSLTAQTATYSTDNTIVLDGADAVWANSTITAKYAVIYDASSGAASTSQVLVGYVDFGADQSSSSGTFTVQWSTAGIVKITVS
jgi:hypothetical protein